MEVITKADGTPTKSRVFAVNFLKNKGIDENCLIEKEGKFYYELKVESSEESSEEKSEVYPNNDQCEPTVEEKSEVEEEKMEEPTISKKETVEPVTECNQLNWDTPVFYDGNNNTELKIKSADVGVKIVAKHPAGQTLTRPYNAFELLIESERFIMSENLCKQIFEVKEV